MKTIDLNFKSKLSRFKNIENRNKAFDALSAKDKRKEIAWDALQMILSEQIKGSYGCYWNSPFHDVLNTTTTSKELQQRLLELNYKENDCKVCARGAMMLSQIRLGNSVKPSHPSATDGSSTTIKGFSIQSFQAMEAEYERSVFEHPYRFNTTEKLANICCNIIVNGNFKVNDTKNYLIL